MAKAWRELYSRIPAARRKAIEADVASLIREMPLHELRRALKLSQEQLAEALGAKQSSISKLEQQTDMYVGTLRRYVEAMGGELVIAARFPAGEIPIPGFGEIAAVSGYGRRKPRKAVVRDRPTDTVGLVLGREAVVAPAKRRKKKG